MSFSAHSPQGGTPTSETGGALLARRRASPSDAMVALISSVIVEPPAELQFPGCVARDRAAAIWTWLSRDLGVVRGGSGALDWQPGELEPLVPDLLAAARDATHAAEADPVQLRRLKTQIGGDAVLECLPTVLAALRNRALLVKAQAFGRATNTMADESALSAALQSMPLQDAPTAAMLLFAAMGQVTSPSRLVNAVIRLAGGATESHIHRTRLGPLIDAILAHAQNQQHLIGPVGPFADIDLGCRGLDRFHKLVRSVSGYVELERGSRWSHALGALTKSVSERVEPRLKDVVPQINGALRRVREGADRVDNDLVLSALGGVYLLATLRDCKDSLAINALFEQTWSQAGQALETHIERNLEMQRSEPGNPIIAVRLDAAIKMAEVRFNPAYAETLRRAALAAGRR